MVIVDCGADPKQADDDLRMILNTGAKFIARAGGAWVPCPSYLDSIEQRKKALAAMHRADEELIFEACIFENIGAEVDDIAIPTPVLETFGRPATDRNFRHKKMRYWFRYHDHFGRGFSVPDLTRLESRMFFYHLACRHIDAGYEALHLGQVHLMGRRDRQWARWTDLLNKIREYARDHARRGFVLINAHTRGIVGADGKLLFDFHSYPVRGRAPENAVPHAPSESEPQEMIPGVGMDKKAIELGYQDSIFKRSMGGVTHSGWECDSLPYIVELDNWNGYAKEKLDRPSAGDIDWWGFDEISWFANQPRWYRALWLERTYNWVRTTDAVGCLEMPGRRTAAMRQPDGAILQTMYSASVSGGSGDEDFIRKIWTNSRRQEDV
jgi:hypothetical protein